MKQLFLFVITLVFSLNTYAQDTLVLRNGNKVLSKVLEIGTTEVSYKIWSNINGPTYKVSRNDISYIKYNNQTIETFEQIAGIPSEIEVRRGGFGPSFWQDGRKVRLSELRNILKQNNPDAFRKYRNGEGLAVIGAIFAGAGAGLAIGNAINVYYGNDMDWTINAVASGAVLVGLIFGGAENKKYIEAVEIYNQGLRRSNKVVDLNFGFTQSGIGLSLTF